MKDLTKIKAPLGLLGKKTSKALRAHSGPIEVWDCEKGWEIVTAPIWLMDCVYRVKPTNLGVAPSGDGCSDDTDAVRSILDDPLTGRAYASPLNHAGCDTPAAIFAAVKEWQESRVALMKPMPREEVFSTHDLMQAAIEKLEALRLPS